MIMAITASFSPGARALSVFGDAASNNIKASRDAAGRILINGGAAIVGGIPTSPTPASSCSARPAMTRSQLTKPTARCRPYSFSAATATTP
jgi:hypothetical protein